MRKIDQIWDKLSAPARHILLCLAERVFEADILSEEE